MEHKQTVSASGTSTYAKPTRLHHALSRSAAGLAIQRKSGCACGGHCPRCKAARSGLTVGAPDDQYEREADHIADLAMSRGPAAAAVPHITADGSLRLRRRVLEPGEQYDSLAPPGGTSQQAAEGPEELPAGGGADELPLQRSPIGPAGSVTAGYEQSLTSAVQRGGQRLPTATRSHMEHRLGWDFSGVRVYSDPPAHRLASQINARAFTYGQNIFFGASEYAPTTASGQRLLAHELAHVMQQSDGRLSRQIQRTNCSAYPGFDNSVNRKTYNCSGLALRTYSWISPPSAVYAAMWREFISPVCPVGNCEPGQVKFWLWDYDIHTEDDLGNIVDPTWHDFHIVGGRCDSAGNDPTNVYSKNGPRPIHGPGTGPSFRPAARDRALDLDDNPGNAPNGRPLFKVRSNMHEEITCASCH